MKKVLKLRRAVCLTGSAVLLCGLLTGFPMKHPGALALKAQAATYYNVQAGSYYRVTADTLNVRSGPGTNYPRQGQLARGTLVQVLDTDGAWGRINSGWVHLQYLNLESGSVSTPSGGTTAVVNTPMLNIRSGPGTNYAIIGKVTNGFRAHILETRDDWGCIGNGWINLNYTNRSSSPSGGTTVLPNGGYSGISANALVEITADYLNIRQGPGTGYNRTSYLTQGQRVTVLETQNGWGRIQGGWISLNYVRAVGTVSGTTGQSGYITAGSTVQVSADSLRVRSGPGTNYQQNGSITSGSRVYIYEVQGDWGRTSSGWIHLDYVYRVG